MSRVGLELIAEDFIENFKRVRGEHNGSFNYQEDVRGNSLKCRWEISTGVENGKSLIFTLICSPRVYSQNVSIKFLLHLSIPPRYLRTWLETQGKHKKVWRLRLAQSGGTQKCLQSHEPFEGKKCSKESSEPTYPPLYRDLLEHFAFHLKPASSTINLWW